MSYLFFFYTLALLVACIVAASISASAWASSRRNQFLWMTGAFILYAVETVEIFFYEHISQNLPFELDEYYEIQFPVIRTIVVAGLLACLWFSVLGIIDRKSRRLALAPVAAFLVANAAVLLLMPYGALRQWSYYTTRQAFLIFMGAYCLWAYHSSSDERYRARLQKYRKPMIAYAALVLSILLEDFYIIMVRPPTDQPDWLLIYLSERNISENVLMVFLAVIVVRSAYRVLSIRMKEAPVKEEVGDLERHIDENMPGYCDTFKLSKRESEVLKLVLMGRNTQEIASDLYLAPGTVKTHVHNILVKTDNRSRETLALHFWKH